MSNSLDCLESLGSRLLSQIILILCRWDNEVLRIHPHWGQLMTSITQEKMVESGDLF